jgi:hypothetical protein
MSEWDESPRGPWTPCGGLPRATPSRTRACGPARTMGRSSALGAPTSRAGQRSSRALTGPPPGTPRAGLTARTCLKAWTRPSRIQSTSSAAEDGFDNAPRPGEAPLRMTHLFRREEHGGGRSPAYRLLAATSRASLTSRAANVPAACPASPLGIHIMHSQAPAAQAYNYAEARACGADHSRVWGAT